MAKPTAPLLSFDASGTIAKTMVFSRWRGIPYVRRHVIPANPNTTGQALTRNTFTMLTELWKVAGPLLVEPWGLYATGRKFLDRNAFIGQNVALVRSASDLALFRASPGARGGLPPDSFSAAAGSGIITCTFTNPTPPTGWAIVAAIAVTFPDQAPNIAFVGPATEGEDTVTPFDTVVLSSLTTVLHQVFGFLEWTKPDGTSAFSVSLQDSATPT